MRVLRRRRIERARGRSLPVDDELMLLFVVHPTAADVQRPLQCLDVESTEAEAALRVLERPQPSRGPCLHRDLSDLTVDAVRSVRDRGAHPLQMLVRVVDVGLFRRQLRMAHIRSGAGKAGTFAPLTSPSSLRLMASP